MSVDSLTYLCHHLLPSCVDETILCLILLPTVIILTMVMSIVSQSSSLTILICHQFANEAIFGDFTVTFCLTNRCPTVIFFTFSTNFLRTSSHQLTSQFSIPHTFTSQLLTLFYFPYFQCVDSFTSCLLLSRDFWFLGSSFSLHFLSQLHASYFSSQ